MSANDSNISNLRYGYDMVVAITQASINATMEQWLSNYAGPPVILAYVYNPNPQPGESNTKSVDFEQLKQDLGFDPFTIPNNTPSTDPRIQKLVEKQFMYAFQTKIGIPDFPNYTIPPIVQFNHDGSNVTYNMLFGTFQIISINFAPYGGQTWTNLSQEQNGSPWSFTFNVDLNIQSNNINNYFHNLPPEIQQQIKNLGEDMFSVQQLFLDFNIINSVSLNGVDQNSQTYQLLYGIFLVNYLPYLRQNEAIVLGYGVVAKNPFPEQVSLIPTDLNFEICPYIDTNGNPTSDYDEYTLNYLIMSKGNPLPSPVQFAWNWVDKDQIALYSGVMSVNRNIFITFLQNLFSETLQNIAYQPQAHFSTDWFKVNFSWGCIPDTTPQAYNVVQDGDHVLTYTYNKSSSDSDHNAVVWGNITFNYTAQSDVYLQGTTIMVNTTLTVNMHLNIEGGTCDGNFAKLNSNTVYTMGVDDTGKITISKSAPIINDQSDPVEPDWWQKFITLGQMNGVVSDMKTSVSSWINSFLQDDTDAIENTMNGSSGWLFPGGKTFTFANVAFSEYQDLVANIQYVDPS